MWNTNTKFYVQSLASSFGQPIQNLSSSEEIWQPCNTRKHSILRATSHQTQHPFRLFLTKAGWFTQNPTSYVLKYRLYFDERVKGFDATKTQKQSERKEKILSLLLWIGESYFIVCCKVLQAKTLPHNTVQYRSPGRLLKIFLWCCAIGRKVWKEEGERKRSERDPKCWVCLDNYANQLSPPTRVLIQLMGENEQRCHEHLWITDSTAGEVCSAPHRALCGVLARM